jgi:hypothetical protein
MLVARHLSWLDVPEVARRRETNGTDIATWLTAAA